MQLPSVSSLQYTVLNFHPVCVCVCVCVGGGGEVSRPCTRVCELNHKHYRKDALYLCCLESVDHSFLQPLYKMGLFKVTLKFLHINLQVNKGGVKGWWRRSGGVEEGMGGGGGDGWRKQKREGGRMEKSNLRR